VHARSVFDSKSTGIDIDIGIGFYRSIDKQTQIGSQVRLRNPTERVRSWTRSLKQAQTI
jgi:hypothetical protein